MLWKGTAALLVAVACNGGASDAPPRVETYGGPVLAHPTVVPVFFDGDPDEAQIEAFLRQTAASDYWRETTSEYGVGSLTVAASVVTAATPPSSIATAGIEAWVAALPALGQDGVYAVFYPKTTTLFDASGNESCTYFGGFHGEATLPNGGSAPYIAMPRCDQQGALAGLDALTAPLSHELVEVSTNPLVRSHPAYAAVDDDHMVWNVMPLGEIGDLCAQAPQSYQRLVGAFMVQRTWSNASAQAGHDPCVPVLDVPYYNVAPVLGESLVLEYRGQEIPTKGLRVPLGTSRTLDVQLFSDAPTGAWSVRATDSSSALTFAWDARTGQSGDTLHVTITRAADGPYRGTEMTLSAQREGAVNAWYVFIGN